MLVRDVPFFCGAFFREEDKFWGIISVKSQVVINFFGCHFRKITYKSIGFDQISLTWLKFQIFVTILGYIFSMACKS